MAAVRTLIAWAGDNPDREGLLDTPRRVVDAYGEWFDGYEGDPGKELVREVTHVESEDVGEKIGHMVLGESIGDLGGAKISYLAFEKSMESKPRPADIDGFTPEQQYFIAWGQFRGDSMRPEFQRLMVQGEMQLDGGVIGQGLEDLRWPRPVLPGDRLSVVTEILELGAVPARPDRGLMKLHCRTLNQHGKTVQEMTATLLVARRPA